MRQRLSTFPRMFAFLPIRWRMALASFGLLTLLLTALGIFISVTEENRLLDSQANVLNNEAQMLQVTVKSTFTREQILTFPALSRKDATDLAGAAHIILGQNVGVSVLSFDGNTLVTSRDVEAASDAHLPVVSLSRSDVRGLLAGNQTYILASDNLGQRELVIVSPVAWPGRDVESKTSKPEESFRKALLQLSVPTSPIDQFVATTRLILVLGLLAALGIAAALTLPLINLALRPLVEMEKVSSRIAAGALSLRLAEPPASDEIGRLARSFNSMVARLEEAFARQRRFVADVSHELRTPLTGLGGSLEMLLLGADNGDEQAVHHLMGGMYSEVERMQRLVADLLSLTHLDEGRLRVCTRAVAVRTLVEEICTQLQGLLQGQELTYHIPPDLPDLRGNSDQVRRILLNVIENALKFTPSGGQVRITARWEQLACIVIEVEDTGIGIPPEALPHVCERFYRVDPSRTRQALPAGGSGLGLAIARELIESQGGTITLTSIIEQGTTVTLRFPVYDDSTPGKSDNNLDRNKVTAIRILSVEDYHA